MSSKYFRNHTTDPGQLIGRRCLLCGAQGTERHGHVHRGTNVIDVVFCILHSPRNAPLSGSYGLDYIIIPHELCLDSNSSWNPCFGSYSNRIGMKFVGNTKFIQPWQRKR